MGPHFCSRCALRRPRSPEGRPLPEKCEAFLLSRREGGAASPLKRELLRGEWEGRASVASRGAPREGAQPPLRAATSSAAPRGSPGAAQRRRERRSGGNPEDFRGSAKRDRKKWGNKKCILTKFGPSKSFAQKKQCLIKKVWLKKHHFANSWPVGHDFKILVLIAFKKCFQKFEQNWGPKNGTDDISAKKMGGIWGLIFKQAFRMPQNGPNPLNFGSKWRFQAPQ